MARGISRRKHIDATRVRMAIEAAERRSSAEIVVSVAPFFIGSVWNAARRTFARLGIDRTRGRNGVLVFIVPARHQVVVLADEAADAQLGPALWSDVAARIASACARGEGTEGLEDGIARLAGALSVPFPHEPGDVNELPDQPHVGGLP